MSMRYLPTVRSSTTNPAPAFGCPGYGIPHQTPHLFTAPNVQFLCPSVLDTTDATALHNAIMFNSVCATYQHPQAHPHPGAQCDPVHGTQWGGCKWVMSSCPRTSIPITANLSSNCHQPCFTCCPPLAGKATGNHQLQLPMSAQRRW
jgi:hypothetical protein